MSDNYQYILHHIDNSMLTGTILDFGCGKGEVVRLGLSRGFNIFGAETFFKPVDRVAVEKSSLKERIKEIKEDRTDFKDNTFDLIVSNQVIEHVENLEEIVKELNRITKPTCRIFAIFPTRNIWLEGHVGIPFAHRFSKRSDNQLRYLKLARKIGLGYYKGNLDNEEWAIKAASKLNEYCHYRSRKEILKIFAKYFRLIVTREDNFLIFKLQNRNWNITAFVVQKICKYPIPCKIAKFFVRKIFGEVMIFEKKLSH